ncbi:CRISPR-associated protein Cmr3 [Allochromatium warmingii]|uniref:CRISPR-associated protein Cmr3 n=1 Tax=Allochromatium warmingii TaxID=61595 RepID=A0A1H3BVV3_ALLWA|nr:type III-B CRISPR module-associated Cmr3 family protein [Allochromatium warmingii]SDX45494.1 CRISPR-associated protein Cmr3 [Allochromatium warmingii]
MTETRQWRFDPLDTWFFREARGFETSGHNELSSLFPPPARTVAGAMRTLIGEQRGVDWSDFLENAAYADLRALIGDGDSLGQLKLTGPYPIWHNERLYPVPLHVLGKDRSYRFLEPGDPVRCDLGTVRLPRIQNAGQNPLLGAKPFETAWLTATNLQQVLAGQPPTEIIETQHLYREEPRLGIARDNARRTGRDGLLYQTRHLRPLPELAIGAEMLISIPNQTLPNPASCGLAVRDAQVWYRSQRHHLTDCKRRRF